MVRYPRIIAIVLAAVTTTLAACANGPAVVGVELSGEGAVGPQQITAATEILRFDPAAVPLGDGEPVGGTCAASTVVPGAYRCEVDGGAVEPCFPLGGARLICAPDPVTGSYETLVSPTGPPPPVSAPPPDRQVQFFVELDGGRTCRIRTGPEPVIVGGAPALYDCNQPYTYLLGFEKSAPIWEAALYTLDPATGKSPSGKTPVDVRRAWIP